VENDNARVTISGGNQQKTSSAAFIWYQAQRVHRTPY